MCEKIENLEVAILPITYRCNAKCTMCGIGDLTEYEELSLNEYERMFRDYVWRENIKSVNITGGEPFLRNDLLRITELLIENTTKLEILVINTNGILTDRIMDYIKQVIPLCSANNILLKIYISLDGIGIHHDQIRKVHHCFEKVDKTICKLTELQKLYDFGVVLNCTVTHLNYQNIYEVLEYSERKKIEINYTYAMESDIFFQNEGKIMELQKEEARCFSNFLKMFIKTSTGAKMSSYYRALIKMLQGEERKIGCIFQKKGIFVHPNGNVFRCWGHNEELGNIKLSTLAEIWVHQYEKSTLAAIKYRCKSCYNNCYQEYQRLAAIEKCFNQSNT